MILAVLLLLTTVMGEAQSRRPRQSQRHTTYSRVQPVRFGLKAGLNLANVSAKYGIDADQVVRCSSASVASARATDTIEISATITSTCPCR